MNQQTKHRHKFSLFDEQTGNIPCGNIVYIIAFFIPVIIFTALYFAREIYSVTAIITAWFKEWGIQAVLSGDI